MSASKRRRTTNRDRSEYRQAGRKERLSMPKGGRHTDRKKARDKRAARGRVTPDD